MPRLRRFVAFLGIAQIVSWGTLFYAIGVLGPAMRKDLGVSELFLFTAFTGGLLVSGALAPLAGRMIDRHGGRVVMSLGSVLGVVSMALLAAAPNAAVMVIGWLLAGAAMAGALYDPAFATLSQHAGERYRRAVTALTLFGGFASTAFWPLSHLLLEAWGWRATFAVYAAMHLLICLPIHLVIPHALEHKAAAANAAPAPPLRPGARLRWLAVCFAIATFIFGIVAVHLINLLTSAGLTAAQAVTISMLVGPLQVAGRVIELMLSGRVRAVTVGYVAFGLMMLALLSLVAVDGMGAAAILFVVAYGCGNGLLTIVRGTAPAELLGREGLGAMLGYLSRAAFFAKAMAPAAYSAMLTIGFARNDALLALAVVALGGAVSFALATRAPAPVSTPIPSRTLP